MVQTFSYRTENPNNNYHHTIHSVDIDNSVQKWVQQIEELQSQVFSFDKKQVENIRQQFLSGQLKIQLDKEPFFLSYRSGDSFQLVYINKLEKGEPDFVAKITYLTTEEGGRKGYASSGYRPHVKFDGRKEHTSGEQLFVDKDKVFPGDTVIAEIRIAGREIFKNYLFEGQRFEIGEGPVVVGHGEVFEIINPELKLTSR